MDFAHVLGPPVRLPVRLLALVASAAVIASCSAAEGDDVARPTAAEYRSAVEAAAACVSAAGFEVTELQQGTDELSWGFGMTVPEGAEEEAERVYDDCWNENVSDIELAYLGDRHLTGAEREQAMEELVACLEEAGVPGLSTAETDSTVFIKEIMSYGTDSPEASAGLGCMDRYRDVWPPGDPNNP